MEPDIIEKDGSLIINRCGDSKNSYFEKMIINANIPGVIKPTIKYFNNSEYYAYNLTNKKSLKYVYENKEIKEDEIINIFTELAKLRINLVEHLLSYDYLLINPEYVFFDIAENRIYFCLNTNANKNIADSFNEFALFLMDRIDEECELAVEIVYKYYENVLNEVFDPNNLLIEYKNSISKNSIEIEQNQETINGIENKEKYYFIEPTNEEFEENEAALLKPLIVCASIILLVGGLYAFVFLNPKILSFIGLSQENYFVIGSAIAFLMSLVLFFIIKIYLKKADTEAKLKEEKENLLHRESMRAGNMELLEFNMKNNK